MHRDLDKYVHDIISRIPGHLSLQSLVINQIRLDYWFEDCENLNFVKKIIEPWDIKTFDCSKTPFENWKISCWSSSEFVEILFSCIGKLDPSNFDSVKRWRGDVEHQRITTPGGTIIVLHTASFRGITIYMRKERSIYCIFKTDPDISHTEHVIKYPARTEGRKYGIFDCHASSITMDGKGVIFLGQRRSGKTTISTELVNMGGKYLSNDLCSIDLSSKKEIKVGSIPHMIRYTKGNLLQVLKLKDQNFKGLIKKDYKEGLVFYGGKYELYPLGEQNKIPLAIGHSLFPVSIIVFPNGSIDKIKPSVKIINNKTTIDQFTNLLATDRPLPDWLSSKETHISSNVIEEFVFTNERLINVKGLQFEFNFSDVTAFEMLVDQIHQLNRT